MKKLLTALLLLACVEFASADTYSDLAAFRHLVGEPSLERGLADTNGDAIFDQVFGTAFSLADIRAHTNDVNFKLWWPTSVEYLTWQEEMFPQNRIQRFNIPIEAPVVILVSHTNKVGYALIVEDDGDSFTVLAHQSPYDEAQFLQNISLARQERKQLKQDLKVLIADVKTNNVQITAIAGTTAQQLTALKRELKDVNTTQLQGFRILRKVLKDAIAE